MNKQKRITIVLAVMLIISSGNFFRRVSTMNIRAVDFVSIFTLGILSGLLIRHVIGSVKKDN